MITATEKLFTLAVFQDVASAEKGLNALLGQGFPAEMLSLIAKESPEVARLSELLPDSSAVPFEIAKLGLVRARGSLVGALQGTDQSLAMRGIAASANRVGFQSHDGRIFETLVSRGGVLLAADTSSRAADALALFHSYGGGNAAIGAWAGRV